MYGLTCNDLTHYAFDKYQDAITDLKFYPSKLGCPTILPFFNNIIILMLFLGWRFNTTCICGIETQVDYCFKWTHTTCLHQIKRNHDWHIKQTMPWRRCAINGCDWDWIENNTFAIHSITTTKQHLDPKSCRQLQWPNEYNIPS